MPRRAECWPPFPRRAAAVALASRGRRGACGWAISQSRRSIKLDPATGDILRTIESNRFVTGVTWVEGELWHGTWEGEESDVRRLDPRTGEVLESGRHAAWRGRLGARVRWRRSVLLRRREEREVRVVRRPKASGR